MATLQRIIAWSNRHRIFNVAANIFQHKTPCVNEFRNVFTTRHLFDETLVKMPALSPTMSSGTIVKWYKKEGDKIQAGDLLCEVQTDKAVVGFEFDEDGILAKILVPENSKEIEVGNLIAIVCGEDDDWKNVKVPEEVKAEKPASSASVGADAGAASKPQPSPQQNGSTTPKIDLSRIKISPSARNLIEKFGLDPSVIPATGPWGTMMKQDVMSVVAQKNLQPKDLTKTSTGKTSDEKISIPTGTTYVDIELSNMRRTIAKRLTESKSTIPHSYLSVKCFMDEVLKIRQHYKTLNIAVSLNDMIVKAAAMALEQVPHMNCQWNQETQSIQIIRDVDISFAVATPGGLITPIVRQANHLTMEEIGATSRQLIAKAKQNKLQPQEFMGGTFSISNLGMYDIDHFIAVINPPQAAILAVGATKGMFFGEPDNYQLRNRAIMTLSYDSRAVDEEVSALFLETLRENLEKPDPKLFCTGVRNRRLSLFAN